MGREDAAGPFADRTRHGRAWRTVATALTAALVASIVISTGATPAGAGFEPLFVRTWGQYPNAVDDVIGPEDLVVGATGEVFVFSGTVVQVFDAAGTFLRSWTAEGAHLAISPVTGNVFVAENGCSLTEYTPTGTIVQALTDCTMNPAGLAVGPDGSVYVADRGSHVVRQFDASLQEVWSWGGGGAGDGKFSDLAGIAVDAGGEVFVADSGSNDRIQVFTAAGEFVRKWSASNALVDLAIAPDDAVYALDGTAPRVSEYTNAGALVTQWGGSSSNGVEGRLHLARGLVVSPAGDVYVADAGNDRVQRFTDAGVFVSQWGAHVPNGRLRMAEGVATDASGNVYVADTGSSRIQVFGPDGTFVRSWRHADNADGVLDSPVGIAVASSGEVYVVDVGHARIQRYAADGTQLGAWGGTGTGDGQFTTPRWLAVAGNGHVYVVDEGADRVQEFTEEGTFVRAWGSNGHTFGKFVTPEGIAIADNGDVYIADRGTSPHRVQRFSADGTIEYQWPLPSIGPRGMVVDEAGVLSVAGCGGQILRFGLDGSARSGWGTPGTADDEFRCTRGIATSGSNVYVADIRSSSSQSTRSRIQQFAFPSGAALDATITVDETDVVAGATLHYHVAIENVGGVPLTDITTDSVAPNCERAVADLDVGERATFDCTHQATVADAGQFTNQVTVNSNEAAPETISAPAVQVSAFAAPALVREWVGSTTSLTDGDPIGEAGRTTDGQGLATDAAGNVYLTGERGYPQKAAVQRFSATGVFDDEWGTPGTGPGELTQPQGLAVAPDGDVFTTECTGGRIQRFSADGTSEHEWIEERTVTSRNTCSPADIAVGPDGTAYVADAANDRIDVISGDTYAPGWGATGTGDGQFDTPRGVAVSSDGTVYVLDAGNRRVQRFDENGAFLGSWGTSGALNGQFDDPRDIAVDQGGRVYVADYGNRRIQVFSPTGAYISKWAVHTPDVAVHNDVDGTVHVYTFPMATINGTTKSAGVIREYAGTGGGLVRATLLPNVSQTNVNQTVTYSLRIDNLGGSPVTGITIDAGDLDGCTGTVGTIAPGGSDQAVTCTFRPESGDTGRVHHRVTVDTNETFPVPSNNTGVQVLLGVQAQFGTDGTGPDQFRNPRGMTANWQGDLYVADCGNNRVQRLTTDGNFVSRFGTSGGGPGQFDCPADVVLHPSGNLLVLDRGNRRVQEFTTGGQFIRAWSTRTTGTGAPNAIDVDDDGNVYVSDAEGTTQECWFDGFGYICETIPPAGNNRVRRFDATGTFLGDWGGYPSRYGLAGMFLTSLGELFLVNRGGIEVDTPTGSKVGGIATGGAVGDLAVDRFRNVWANEDGDVVEYTPGGFLLARYGSGLLSNPTGTNGIAVDRDNIYVNQNFASNHFGFQSYSVTKLGVVEPQLEVEVTTEATTVVVGERIDYRAVIENTGTSLITGMHLADGTGTGCTAPATSLPPGASSVLTCDYTPTQADAGTWTRAVTVESNETDPVSDSVEVTVDGTAITGTVTEDGSGTGIDGAFVVVLRADNLSFVLGDTTSDGGQYRLNVPSGDYYLQFNNPGAHGFEWYDDQPTPATFGDLTHVVVTDGQATVADASLAPLTGGIAGRVTNETTGHDASGVYVIAVRDGVAVGRSTSFSDGTYRIDGLRPGNHLLVFFHPAARYRPEFHDDSVDPAAATPVMVTAGSRATIDAALTPTTPPPTVGSIVGRVRGGSVLGTDRYIYGALVVALRTSDMSLAAAGLTDFTGHYSMPVPAGSYHLEFADPSGANAFEWYDDQPNPATFADLTPVSAGQFADADLAPISGLLRGTVTETGSGDPIRHAWVVATGPSGTFASRTESNGSYALLNLPPGTYTVVIVDPTNDHRPEFYDNQPGPTGATPVVVTPGRQTLDVALDPN